ncbi:transcriptional repressor [Sulfurospirillum sp. T05]|uniref:Transcriptional repressor n=1 Tax=Sulfurospirillum tamanense TaxID=2813362 RepID=A0ABS2WQG0_9BACT|nr:transcriptional repressor [Sulfurospirillum tamanensis]MBN2963931.1 transcriptional repressor [Sulfurospirillum tamanensis]
MKEVSTQLTAHNIKPTPARTAIFDVLQHALSPLNYDQITDQMPMRINKATFYRAISIFEKEGLVTKFESDDRKWYFELSPVNHAHFICETCHEVRCTNVPIPKASEGNAVKSVILKGTCKACQ